MHLLQWGLRSAAGLQHRLAWRACAQEVVESDEKQECAPENGSVTDDEVARINEASQDAKDDRTKEEGAKLEQTAPAPAADRKSSWFRPGDSKAVLISLLLLGGIVACNLPVTPNLKEADTQDTRLLETAKDAEELDLEQPARMTQFDLQSVGLEDPPCMSADA